MRKLIFAILTMVSWAPAQEIAVGSWVQLKATSSLGVPLHKDPKPSLVGRAPDGARAEVIELADSGHWLKLRFEDNVSAWVIERYVDREVSPPSSTSPTEDEVKVWKSLEDCRTVVNAGRRMAPAVAGTLRVGAWNIRWFPDETNLDWLACAIAWMNVDVLAVSEIRDTQDARTAMTAMLAALGAHTGSTWSVDLQQCGPPQSQHVGFLWNTPRVTLANQSDRWEFNARATAASSPCKDGLRPGRYAWVRGAGGGVDFHMVAVHTKSGATAAAQAERNIVLDRLDTASAGLIATDGDIVVIGDMNTMGTGTAASATAEVAAHAAIASAEAPGFDRMQAGPACTEYFQKRGGWLDHALVTRQMAEVVGRTARVTGYCAVNSCADIAGDYPDAYKQLSDHCPLVFEIRNMDID